MTRPFIAGWLDGEPGALAFLGPGVRDVEARRRHVSEAAARRISPALAAELRAQNAALHQPIAATHKESLDGNAASHNNHAATQQPPRWLAHLDALAAGGTAAIVTGQQVGLFLGPLFTFYKAASAVMLARTLEAETGVRCVPIFWLQSEDHDFAEIRACHLPSLESGGEAVRVALDEDDSRVSVADRALGPSIDRALEELGLALAPLPHAAEVMALARAAYRPERSPVSAFARMLAALFEEEGLLLFDPRTPAVARLAEPLLRRAIDEHAAIDKLLNERGRALAAAGFAEQVPIREGSPLCFVHESDKGPRHRIERRGDQWTIADGTSRRSVDDAALAALPPLALSTSALLRPIVQDALLPTAVYVAGPGELSYWAQLGPLHAHFGVAQPAVALRARLRIVDERTRSLLERSGWTPADLERPRETLLAEIVERAGGDDPRWTPAALEERLLADAGRTLDELAARMGATLARPIERTRETLRRAASRLAVRYRHALAERDLPATLRLERLSAILFPGGAPQERYYGFPAFAARFGMARLKELVMTEIHAFGTAVRDLHA